MADEDEELDGPVSDDDDDTQPNPPGEWDDGEDTGA